MEIIEKDKTILEKELNKIINDLDTIILEKMDLIKADPRGDFFEERDDKKLKEYDVEYIKNKLAREKRCFIDILLQDLLAYYLEQIKTLNVKKYFELMKGCWRSDEYNKIPEEYKKASRLIDDVIDYCDPCGKYDEVYEDAEYIASTLMRKKLEINGHCLSEPLQIDFIKSYSISTDVAPSEFYKEIWYIILYIAVHYNVLKRIK